MMNYKNWIKGTVVLGAGFLLAACGNDQETETDAATSEETTLRIGASNVPHAEILEFVTPKLEEEGITLEIERYNDYVIPNVALEEGDIDANYFQHGPFFEDAIAENHYDFVNAGGIHIEPIAAYSDRHESLEDLQEGAKILVSSNAPDYGRVLAILEEADLITVADGVDLTTASFDDIAENPLDLQFEYEYDPALMPTLLENDEGDVVFINSNFAVDHDLNPLEDSLAIESSSSPYANIIAVRSEDADNPAIANLIEALRSDETQDFILETWKGSVVPVTE
ncbi:D-methionine transport system substrate-binding protein [Atopostipes suicloacalis DSM 15692]|uniref:Lipoprotein n=2 Tax=Atopostipes suicloacalis TaxID=180295 RepID=A0A1M4SEK3_9LACT|nr:D-methionine transport system substrate-binding protein [Atopostipes suicloacalis DSM 15692]